MASSILIVKLSSLGDVVHTLPAAQALRAAFPNARLGWAVEQGHAALVRDQPWLDEVIEWPRQTSRTFYSFIRRLRQTRWDVAIDFQGLIRSALVTRLSGARRRVGFSPTRELAHWLYTEKVPLVSMEEHAVERSLRLAAHLGATMEGLPIDRPYLTGQAPTQSSDGPRLFPLHSTTEDVAAVEGWLAEQRFDARTQRLVILNPHCRKDANQWLPEYFTELARRLLERPDIRVALSGGPVARELCDRIAAPLGRDVWRADGRFSLLRSTALFRRAELLVTGDTGPMHLAVAVGTPVVALFGPASPLRTGPYASDAVVLSKRLECSPCFARQCPLKHDPPLCMQQITVDETYQAVMEALHRSATRSQERKSA
jgi:lipopolysaccharide heptosyltransferase I